MRRIIISKKAREDLINIWRYTYAEWGEEQAKTYHSILDRSFQRLAENPLIGRSRPELGFSYDLRTFRINQHIVVYTLSEQSIKLVRVLHKSMDIHQI